MERPISDLANDMQRGAEAASATLRALSNPSRLLLLCHLVEAESSVSELVAALGMGQAYVSQQLARLRTEGIVTARRDGRSVLYSLADPRVAAVLKVLHTEFCSN